MDFPLKDGHTYRYYYRVASFYQQSESIRLTAAVFLNDTDKIWSGVYYNHFLPVNAVDKIMV